MIAAELLAHAEKNKGLRLRAKWLFDGHEKKGAFQCDIKLDAGEVLVIPCAAGHSPMRMNEAVFKEAYGGEWQITDVSRG